MESPSTDVFRLLVGFCLARSSMVTAPLADRLVGAVGGCFELALSLVGHRLVHAHA